MDLNQYMAKPDKTIALHTQEVAEALDLLYKYGYLKDEHIYQLARMACLLHDIGKVNSEFQKRVTSLKKILFQPEKEVAHNVLSSYFLDRKDFEEAGDYYKVLYAILYHHHYEDPLTIIMENKNLIQKLLSDFEHFNIKRSDLSKIADLTGNIEVRWIKGLLHKCDYSASAGYQVEYKNDFLKTSLEACMTQWKVKKPDAKWNELQLFCMEHNNENLIVKADTGMGKTEAGLHWIGDNKGFFILPLRTAINAIYDRVSKGMLGNDNLNERIGILHSDSLEYYLKNQEEESEKLLDYELRGKKLSLPLSISTLDQLFDFTLKYPAYELKLTTLAYSKVVIDEIQMYDPNLLAYLIHGIQMITEMGGKVAILTATFPKFLHNLLGPITFTEGTFSENQIRHNVQVLENELEETDIYNVFLRNQSTGISNKILVICNTIGSAQRLFQELNSREELEGNVHLLHSQFIKKDRSQLEKEIIAFGKTFDEKGNIDCSSGIWVSTSLVEASLDIDFDFLFTELKDLSSIFQRMGRCNRKGVKDISLTNCYVYTKIDEKDLSTSGHGFIDKQIFELSKKALKQVSGPLSETDKMELMDQYFRYEDLVGSDYLSTYEHTKKYLESITVYKIDKSDINLRNILAQEIIPHPILNQYGDEIKNCEKELSKSNLSRLDRSMYSEKIRQYTVSIPLYAVKNYEKALRQNMAASYGCIHIDSYHTIQVMECYYDEMGFQRMDYNNVVREANILD